MFYVQFQVLHLQIMALPENDLRCTMEDQVLGIQEDHNTEDLLIIRLELVLSKWDWL